MPKFHFEIVDGYKTEDPVGLDCKSESSREKWQRTSRGRLPSTS